MASEERLRELEEKYENYKVYDNRGDKIGKVDDLFVDETDREEYIGVKLGLLGRKSTLIPMEIVRVNEADRTIEVSDTKDHVTDAPSFDDDEDITGEYERRIRDHFGLESTESTSSRGSYGGYSEGGVTDASATEGHDDSYEHSAHGESTGSTSNTGGSQSVPEYQSSGESSGGGTEGSLGSSASSEGTGQQVPTSRQTEETETFQEGGRTKVRRRIVREEIFDADEDQSTRS